jgi:hypothetical protein
VTDQRGVAGYYRVSVARDDMKAPELYVDEITRYCAYRNLVLKEIFSDIDYSGYNHSGRRPALNELVRRRHEFAAVIVPKSYGSSSGATKRARASCGSRAS